MNDLAPNRLNMDLIKHDYEVSFYNGLKERRYSLSLKQYTAEEVELRVATTILNCSYSSNPNDHIKEYSVHYQTEVNKTE